jgi:hypothetical protein
MAERYQMRSADATRDTAHSAIPLSNGESGQGRLRMAGRQRFNPYKNFNFRAVLGAAVLGAAAIGLGGKLLLTGRKKKPKPKPPEEPVTGPRPIEGVGTSVASFPRTASKPPRRRGATAKPRPRKPRKPRA